MLEKLAASMCFRDGRVTAPLYCVQFIGNVSLPPPAALSIPEWPGLSWQMQLGCVATAVCGGHQLQLSQGGLHPGGPPEARGGASSLECVDLGDKHRVPRGEGTTGPLFPIGYVARASP